MLVTVITVCRNSEATLKACLSSVANQSYKNIEHIVVYAESTDSTENIIGSWSEHEILKVQEETAGIYESMNQGLEIASGEIIGFLNSDDVYASEDTLSLVVQRFQSSQQTSFVYGDICFCNPQKMLNNNILRSQVISFQDLLNGITPFHPTFYIRREVLEKIRGFNTNYTISADFDFMLRVYLNDFVGSYINKVLIIMMPGGVSNRFWGVITGNIQIIRSLLNNNCKFNPFIYIFKRLSKKIVSRVFLKLFPGRRS